MEKAPTNPNRQIDLGSSEGPNGYLLTYWGTVYQRLQQPSNERADS